MPGLPVGTINDGVNPVFVGNFNICNEIEKFQYERFFCLYLKKNRSTILFKERFLYYRNSRLLAWLSI